MHIIFFLLLVLLTYFLVKLYRSYAIQKQFFDYPNQRSSHLTATPRGGGLIITILWLVVGMISWYFFDLNYSDWLLFMLPAMLIMLIGYADDRFEINIKLRFTVQFIAAILAVLLFYFHPEITISQFDSIQLHWLVYLIVLISLVWSTNLFNFLDGLDGYAATEAIFIFTLTGFLIHQSSNADFETAYLAWTISAMSVGFLLLNWPTAKIFMGDVCSGFLGFMFVIFAYYATAKIHVSILLFVYMYGLFWFDATVTLIRRIIKGDKWYQSHNLHAYQRLYQSGFSHLQVLLCNISINLIIAGLVLWAYYQPTYLFVAGMAEICLLIIFYLWVEYKKPMYKI